MTSVLDLWRAMDPEARLVSGSTEHLARPVRGIARTRAAPPHLPSVAEGALLVADAALLAGNSLDSLLTALHETSPIPVAVWLVSGDAGAVEGAGDDLPVLLGTGSVSSIGAAAERHLEDEVEQLGAFAAGLRLAGAEAALTDPQPSAPAGVLATRLRRGVAVTVDGALRALNPRPAGRALATRFAAAHARLLSDRSEAGATVRRTRDGLWVLERSIGPGASAWLFDDLPPARIDEVGLEALAVTLRALLRRRAAEPSGARRMPKALPSTGDPLHDTLLAVARANGRIAPAARSLGVHRNTVLYRLRRAQAELGIDPRRPDDALRLLRSSDEPR
ncbi:MAG TPA: helix-turn-helix domain-containing protein [Candidatus Limnocylindrales bacterium]|nr:helix-turn-helix domain-containing protein [Candidatus Limnocylindrales bacterium]